jgi:hypothetical protein
MTNYIIQIELKRADRKYSAKCHCEINDRWSIPHFCLIRAQTIHKKDLQNKKVAYGQKQTSHMWTSKYEDQWIWPIRLLPGCALLGHMLKTEKSGFAKKTICKKQGILPT